MEPGEERTVTVPADRGFGPHRPELMLAVDRSEFPNDIQPQVGQQLEVRHEQGQVSVVTVADVSDEQAVARLFGPEPLVLGPVEIAGIARELAG